MRIPAVRRGCGAARPLNRVSPHRSFHQFDPRLAARKFARQRHHKAASRVGDGFLFPRKINELAENRDSCPRRAGVISSSASKNGISDDKTSTALRLRRG
jgi:hypothetical protein